MTMLVTLDEGKAHLRVDHDSDDDDITLKIEAASAAVLNYIGDTQFDFLDTSGELVEDSSGPATIPAVCRQATLLMLGYFYKDREPGSDDPFFAATVGYGYLPRAVVALLYPLRAPVIA